MELPFTGDQITCLGRDQAAQSRPTTVAWLTASRKMRELEKALSRLRDEQREVVLLVGLEGMSYEAAAQILDVPVGTVRSRLSRGRDALRVLLDMPERGQDARDSDLLAEAA